jgi:2-aminoethylphosphonate-pyruvate transaminase
VKQAMLHDLGSRDEAFIEVVAQIRAELLNIAGTSREDGFEAILMQGSGTFGLEAIVGSVVPPDGALLVLVNGAYGERVVRIAEVLKIPVLTLRCAEDTVPDMDALDATLARHPEVTTVSMVHCETTTGILNPVAAIGKVVHRHGRTFIVDAMSSFGAIPVDLEASHIDFLATSANKCLEGVPGFAIILARRAALLATEGYARSLSLDLLAQWRGLERNGQFRFTPPTHTLLAHAQALRELAEEGGVAGRAARYRANHRVVMEGMKALGFRPYLDPRHQSYIITSFLYPDAPGFDFEAFYEQLSDRGFVIYPGKLTRAECFRIGNIGRLGEGDMHGLLEAVGQLVEAWA